MNINEQERIDAINRYIKGDKPADIYRDANRSRKWLTGWVNRFKTGEEEWYRSRSRAPEKHGIKTNEEIEKVVVNIRKALVEGTDHESKYLGVGTDAGPVQDESTQLYRRRYPIDINDKANCKETRLESE